MGYQVKWVEENLGITRKTLRVFENMGLMPKNQGRQYRDYSQEDIEQIWTIRLLQGMGYSLKEIVNMVNDPEFEIVDSIGQKIDELERQKADIERHIGYAKTIKLTGRFPTRPKEMGSIRFKDFQEKSLSGWNCNSDDKTMKYSELVEMFLNQSESEWSTSDLGQMLDVFEEMVKNPEIFEITYTIHALLKGITRRIDEGRENQEVQTMVRLIYEYHKDDLREEDDNFTPQFFARFFGLSFIYGDIARLYERNYGVEGCRFIADAVAYFAGYSNFDEIE